MLPKMPDNDISEAASYRSNRSTPLQGLQFGQSKRRWHPRSGQRPNEQMAAEQMPISHRSRLYRLLTVPDVVFNDQPAGNHSFRDAR